MDAPSRGAYSLPGNQRPYTPSPLCFRALPTSIVSTLREIAAIMMSITRALLLISILSLRGFVFAQAQPRDRKEHPQSLVAARDRLHPSKAAR